MKSILTIAVLLFMIPQQTINQDFLNGTTVVAIRTPNEILLGADSNISAIENESLSGSICKIIQVDNLFFASARLIADTSGQFSVPSTVIKARKKGGTILDTVNTFESLIVPQLKEILIEIKHEHPQYYQKEIEGRSAVDVVFFGIEKNTPVLYMRYFQGVSSSTGEISITVHRQNCPGDCPSGIAYTALGHHDAIDKVLSENRGFWKIGWVEATRKLIEIEIADQPKYVAPPIDILQVDGKGARWIQKKSQCPEIKKY